MRAALDPDLLAILVCPATRTPLRYDRRAGELISDAAGLAYPDQVVAIDGRPLLPPSNAPFYTAPDHEEIIARRLQGGVASSADFAMLPLRQARSFLRRFCCFRVM